MSLRDTAAFFAADALRHHRHYPVVDGQGRPLGVICRADVLKWMVEDGSLSGMLGARVAGQKITIARSHEFAGRLADRLVEQDAGCALVLSSGDRAVEGIVTRGDLLRVRANFVRGEQEREVLMKRRGKRRKSRAKG
jgi:CBS domain-containing protein